jgi:MFS family permease
MVRDATVPGAEMSSRPSRVRVLVVTSLAHFMNDGMVFFIPVVAALLAAGHASSPVVITAMLTVFYLSSAGFGVVVGLTAASGPSRGRVMALGLFVVALGLWGFVVALGSAPGPGRDALAIASAMVAGVGSAVYHPVGGSILQSTFGGSAGRALGVNGSFGSLGRALYPTLFVAVTALDVSRGGAVAIFAGAGVASALVIAGTLRHLTDPQGSVEHATRAARPRLRSLLTRSVVALMVIAFLRSVAFIGVVSWMPIYLTFHRHLGVTSLGLTVTTMYLGGIVGQPVFGLLADRFDKRWMLALDSVGSALATVAYVASSGAWATVFLVLFGFFTFSGFPLLLSLVPDYVAPESHVMGNALVWGVGSTGGQALGPLVVTLLTGGAYHRLGFAFTILAALAAFTAVGTPLLVRVARRGRVALFG